MSVVYTKCVLAERLVRAKVDVAERKLAFLGRLLHLYGSHHPWRSLVLAMRHCGYNNDITVWRRGTIAKAI